MNRRDFKGSVWRELCARAVEANCGYSSGYFDRYALSWDVAINWGVPDADSPGIQTDAFNALAENWGVTREQFDAVVSQEAWDAWAEEWDDESSQSRVWSWVQEDMARGVTDADTYRTIRREIATRYGLSYERFPKQYTKIMQEDKCYYPAGVKGWQLVNPWTMPQFKVEWEFAGRQGKHLCLSWFEGKSLRMRSDDLSADITSDSEAESYSNEWCQKLLAFIHECDLCFTSANVKQEFEYQVSFRAADELHDLYEECVAAAKEKAEADYWAERDVMTEA